MQTWIEDFSKAPFSGPQCLFFFIIKVKGIHEGRHHLNGSALDILDCIQTLTQRYSDNSILIESLPPVGVHFVESWLDKVLDGVKPMKLFEQWIKAEEGICLNTGMCLDMQTIHAFQRMVWQHGQKT
ncbi:MAG: hypothetical protein IPN20_03610 [Haliscomenobacter sp.]|nr:hypothetical protein [Haliscomenobacter sp.]